MGGSEHGLDRRTLVKQGQVYWLEFRGTGSEPSGRRPAVVIQHDRFNRSAIATIVVAAITSNVRRAAMPGNVRLRRGEANLPQASVVNVTQLLTVDRQRLQGPIGALTSKRLLEVMTGISLVLGAPDEIA